jgi:FKBP-type peptidyl-prolyl cis-trans isomerase SlyD
MKAQVISFKCHLKNKAGKLISFTYNRDVLTLGEETPGLMLAGLNRGLRDLKKGEKRVLNLSAEEAYGLYDPQKIILFPLKKLPHQVRKGEMINIISKSGVKRAYTVLEIHSDLVSLDGNHPLAGQDLIFEIEALDAREATHQEIFTSLNTVAGQTLH